jgi:hypothetical protein
VPGVPPHGSRYDLDTGQMVAGRKGLLGYVGKTPGCTELVRAYRKVLVLPRRRAERRGDQVVVAE